MKLLGEELSVRAASCQTARLQIRAALPNCFAALGTPKIKHVA
jgi:hypothetical protein